MSQNILAVIPARGGSKGVPRKNVLFLAGKPLVAHTIEQALRAQCVNRVAVSTDDAEIASVARQYGAEVVWRPDEISNDTASSEAALLHTLEQLEQTENYRPDLLVFLQCTSPLTLSADIDGTVEALLEQDADSAFAAAPFHYFVWQWDSQGSAVGINHDKRHRPRRQDREPQFIETGAVYVMRVDGFRAAKHRFFGKTTLYVMPMERNLEIDALEDFRAAERCMRERQEAQRHRSLPNPVAALVMDFDGVFTDNKVIVMQDGTEAVACSRGDGWGLGHLRRLGLLMLVLSTEKNPVVQARCDKLRLPCIHGVWDKGAALAEWMRSNGVNPAHVIYIGNDVNDLNCFSLVGCPVAVSDAHPDIMAAARIVLSAAGGSGALRELAELIAPSLERNTRA